MKSQNAKRLSLALAPQIYDLISRQAEEKGVSRSNLVTMIVSDYYSQQEMSVRAASEAIYRLLEDGLNRGVITYSDLTADTASAFESVQNKNK